MKDLRIVVDACDRHLLKRHHFTLKCKRGKWYAETRIEGRTVGLHRLVMGVEHEDGSVIVDHEDGDGLNNRRSNLRLANTSQNAINVRPRKGARSRYKGVDRHRGQWRARLQGRHLGYFRTQRAAAIAYDTEVLARFGQYAVTNVIEKV